MKPARRTNAAVGADILAAAVDGPFTLDGLAEKAQIRGSRRYDIVRDWVGELKARELCHVSSWRRSNRGGRMPRGVQPPVGRYEPVFSFGPGKDARQPS